MDEKILAIFSANLRRLLSEANKSQADLARYMGVSSASVSDWCNGYKMPRADKMQSICNWLHVDLSDLITDQQSGKKVYYLDDETARVAQELHDDPELRVLFDAARDSRPEDLQMAADLLRRLKDTNPEG